MIALGMNGGDGEEEEEVEDETNPPSIDNIEDPIVVTEPREVTDDMEEVD